MLEAGNSKQVSDSAQDGNITTGKGPEWLIGSVLGSLSCLMLRRKFDPPLRRMFPLDGIVPLELT